jgi:hypothetical protein
MMECVMVHASQKYKGRDVDYVRLAKNGNAVAAIVDVGPNFPQSQEIVRLSQMPEYTPFI